MAKKQKPKPSPLAKLPELSRYVSRGGDKLRGALDAFGIRVAGKTCMDVGCSTGGFTDCLLQDGAKRVIAIDVGYGLLDFKLRNNPRVDLFERTNFRHLERTLLNDSPELATVDVSFISLDKILPKLREILIPGGEALVLVKPQFEGSPKEVPGGFVKDESTRQCIVERIHTLAETTGFQVHGVKDSIVRGRKGNQETFFYLRMP